MNRESPALLNFNEKLATDAFINNHKGHPKDFSRDRVLNFTTVFMLIFKKSIKSLQLILNELFICGSISSIVTASAYTQARKKFKHTAFVELNDDTVRIYYEDERIKRWKGLRCIGGDSSVIILPRSKDIEAEFGSVKIRNQTMEDKYSSAKFMCFYDVLNRIAIKSELASSSSHECDIAMKLLNGAFKEDDLLIFDRGYASYEFLATMVFNSTNFIVRCPKKSFSFARDFHGKNKQQSRVVTITTPPQHKKKLIEKGLPLEITVRFVSVILSTGEIEVLATSLLDKTISCNDFKELYNLRWGVEVFFNLLKGRLNLENFTGRSAESVKQDFWSSILICNIETILTENCEDEMNVDIADGKYVKRINHAVSFNAIKNMAFDVFINMKNVTEAREKLRMLFKTGSIIQRKERHSPRKKMNLIKLYSFARRTRKHVF